MDDVAPTFNKKQINDRLTTPVSVPLAQKATEESEPVEPVTFDFDQNDFANDNDDESVFADAGNDDFPLPPRYAVI